MLTIVVALSVDDRCGRPSTCNPVTGRAKSGTFEIANVPAGRHTIQAWHELYGALKQTVLVTSGAAATVDFKFSGTEQSPTVEKNGVRSRDAR